MPRSPAGQFGTLGGQHSACRFPLPRGVPRLSRVSEGPPAMLETNVPVGSGSSSIQARPHVKHPHGKDIA